jgi:hypothetical protein
MTACVPPTINSKLWLIVALRSTDEKSSGWFVQYNGIAYTENNTMDAKVEVFRE